MINQPFSNEAPPGDATDTACLAQVALDALPQHVAIIRADGVIVSVNAAWDEFARVNGDPTLRTTGVGVDYLAVCRRAAEANSPGAQETLAGLLAVLSGARAAFDLDYPCDSPTEERWYALHARRLPQPADQYLLITHTDITAHQRSEAALRESEERAREVLENSLDAAYKRNLTTNAYEYLSPVFEQISGYTPAEFINLPLEVVVDLIHPDDRSELNRSMTAALANAARTAHHVEYRFKHKAAGYLWLHDQFAVMRDAQGQPVALIGNVRDITERKQAEQSLRESEAKFRAVVENSNDGILFGDAQAVIQYRSPSYNRINGYTDEERLGHSGFETVHPDDAPDLRRWWGSMLDQPDIAHKTEYRVRHKDGTWRWIETSGQNLLGNPDVHSVVVTSRDITERKQLAQALAAERDLLEQRVADRTRELAAANVRLQDLDRLKSKFVSEVSHELRTPVTSLTLYLSLLEHGKPEKHTHYLSSATQQAERMKQLIEDILDLSRLERDKADLTLAPIDLNAVLEQAVIAQQPRAETVGLHLTSELAAELPAVRGDINQLRQVATNLIANAINYTSTGAIQVRSFQRGDRVGFEVQDTGMGIAPEDLAHLGERFYRGQRASQSSVRGTGLGLNIVKEIVEWHGGQLEVQSEVGVGSTFTLWLPAVVG